ncbi:hypothetical protein Tco_1080899 [Tanacetum coccineum]|uniref:Uncharacterized protein n=1 Tax=Tanacetum coccineum TaxID=301880 RepID=A0ABQ5HX97_9ASTR
MEKNTVVVTKDVVSPSMIEEPVGSSLDGNTSGISYANVTCAPSRKALKSSYARVMIKLRDDVELKDTIIVVFGHIQKECPKNIGLGEAKKVKKPSQTPRGVPIGPKVGFKPTKEYRPVSKKPTANTSGNKMKAMEPTKENVETSSTSTTPTTDKIRKLEKLIINGKVTLVDDDGKPLKQVDYLGDHDSEDEVE